MSSPTNHLMLAAWEKDHTAPTGACTNGRPTSNNAILASLRGMGYAKGEMTGHGFRSMARTTLDEVLNVRPDLIEHQLAHAVRDPPGRAYNRTKHLPERRKMMQQRADYLDGLKAEVTWFHSAKGPLGDHIDVPLRPSWFKQMAAIA